MAFRLLAPLPEIPAEQAREYLDLLWDGYSREDLEKSVRSLRERRALSGDPCLLANRGVD